MNMELFWSLTVPVTIYFYSMEKNSVNILLKKTKKKNGLDHHFLVNYPFKKCR